MIYIFGGGTVSYVRSHFALCAPAYGQTARQLHQMLLEENQSVSLELTKMGDSTSKMESNADVESRLLEILKNKNTKAIVFNVALCDFDGKIGEVESGKYAERLHSRDGQSSLQIFPAKKILSMIKTLRPDVFVVGFKTTAESSVDEQISLAQRQIQETNVDLVFANDTVTRMNFLMGENGIVTEPSLNRKLMLSILAQKLSVVEVETNAQTPVAELVS